MFPDQPVDMPATNAALALPSAITVEHTLRVPYTPTVYRPTWVGEPSIPGTLRPGGIQLLGHAEPGHHTVRIPGRHEQRAPRAIVALSIDRQCRWN